jgi:Domain of Unknown Function (DUF928)
MKLSFLYLFLAALLACHPQQGGSPQPAPQQTKQSASPADPEKSPKGTLKKHAVIDMPGFDLLAPKQKSGQPMVNAASRGAAPVLLAPILGKAYGSRPIFQWEYSGKESRFVFLVQDEGLTEIFKTEVTGNTYFYSETAPHLAPGRIYHWSVQPANSNMEAPVTAAVWMVGAEERDEVASALAAVSAIDPFQAELAKAHRLAEHRLWYDAVAAYSDLIAKNPRASELYEQRGEIYAQLPVTKDLGDRDFARAQEIENQEKTQ